MLGNGLASYAEDNDMVVVFPQVSSHCVPTGVREGGGERKAERETHTRRERERERERERREIARERERDR
jgi:hypothetical protein